MTAVGVHGTAAGLLAATEAGPYADLTGEPAGAIALRDLDADDRVAVDVERVRVALYGDESGSGATDAHRVAVSTWHLALVARLAAAALGSTVLGGVVPRLDAGSVGWSPEPLRPLVALEPTGVRVDAAADPAGAAALLLEHVVGTATQTLGELAVAVAAVPPQVLTGNVASSYSGAVAVTGQARPDTAATCRAVLAALLVLPGLREAVDPVAGGLWRRRSCCLVVHAPGRGLCGDCVLHEAPVQQIHRA